MQKNLTLENAGTLPVRVDAVTFQGGLCEFDGLRLEACPNAVPFSLNPGESHSLPLSFLSDCTAPLVTTSVVAASSIGVITRRIAASVPPERLLAAALVIAVLVTLAVAVESLARRTGGSGGMVQERRVPEEDVGGAEGGFHAAALKHIQRINSKYVAGTSRLLEATNSSRKVQEKVQEEPRQEHKEERGKRAGNAKENNSSGGRESNSGGGNSTSGGGGGNSGANSGGGGEWQESRAHKNGSVAPAAVALASPRVGGAGILASPTRGLPASPARVKGVAHGGDMPFEDEGGKVRRSAGVIGGEGADPSSPNGIPRRRTDHETSNSIAPGRGGVEELGGFAVPPEVGHMQQDGGRGAFPLFAGMEGSPFLGGSHLWGPGGGGSSSLFSQPPIFAPMEPFQENGSGRVGEGALGGEAATPEAYNDFVFPFPAARDP
ncbi:hypothetical protein T484DRAFT_1930019 [Baffinella frigidus]|nr:hypothetical protein T484DRAFT_1930019 [Cryptophyta sp. CCMP2293]